MLSEGMVDLDEKYLDEMSILVGDDEDPDSAVSFWEAIQPQQSNRKSQSWNTTNSGTTVLVVILSVVAVAAVVGCCCFWIWKCRKNAKKDGLDEDHIHDKEDDEMEAIQPMILKKDSDTFNEWWRTKDGELHQESLKGGVNGLISINNSMNKNWNKSTEMEEDADEEWTEWKWMNVS